MNFARAAASDGFSVLTPEVAALADYHVDGASISTIGESTAWLQQRLGTGPVTIVGVSFAGGLSLLAACDPRYAPHIRALVLMGAYDDLGRVVRFLATSQAEFPDGRMEPYAAHDYGAAVFVYSHLEQFFPASDLAVAHDALRDWLWEQPNDAQALFPRLSPPSRATMEILLARQIDRLRPKLLDAIQADDSQLSAISPQGKLGALHTPVFLLHGATDDIIPSTETPLAGKRYSEAVCASRPDYSRVFSRRSRQTCRVDRSVAPSRVPGWCIAHRGLMRRVEALSSTDFSLWGSACYAQAAGVSHDQSQTKIVMLARSIGNPQTEVCATETHVVGANFKSQISNLKS